MDSEKTGTSEVQAELPIRCPGCGKSDYRISYHRGMKDHFAAMFSLSPLRCRACGKRFYRNRRVVEALRERSDNP